MKSLVFQKSHDFFGIKSKIIITFLDFNTTHPQHKTIHYVTSSEDNGEMAIIILEYILSINEADRIYKKPVPWFKVMV